MPAASLLRFLRCDPLLIWGIITGLAFFSALLCTIASTTIALYLHYYYLDDGHKLGRDYYIYYGLFPLVVLISESRRLWPTRYWLTAFELIWLTAELVGYFILFKLYQIETLIAHWARIGGDLGQIYFVTLIGIGPLCFISLLVVSSNVFVHRGANLLKPYNLGFKWLSTAFRNISLWISKSWNTIFKRRFTNDNIFIRSIRGIFAMVVFLSMIVVSGYLLILLPYQSHDLEFRSLRMGDNSSFISAANDVSTIYIILLTNHYPDYFFFVDHLSVSITHKGNTTKLECDTWPGWGNVQFCNIIQPTFREMIGDPGDFVSFPVSDNCLGSQFQISLNFTPEVPPDAIPLRVSVGFTDSIYDIIENTEPIYFLPGSRSVVSSSLMLGEKRSDRHLAPLGIPGNYSSFLFLSTATPWLLTNTTELQGVPPQDDRIGHITVSLNNQLGNFIQREENRRSAVDGFATLGGVWTVMEGVFGAIFGSTLFLVLFNRKPLSAYGFIHGLKGGGHLYLDGKDELTPEMQRKILELLRNHLLDTGDDKSESKSATELEGRPEAVDANFDAEALLPVGHEHSRRRTSTSSMMTSDTPLEERG